MYHNEDTCPVGRQIPLELRKEGTGGRPLLPSLRAEERPNPNPGKAIRYASRAGIAHRDCGVLSGSPREFSLVRILYIDGSGHVHRADLQNFSIAINEVAQAGDPALPAPKSKSVRGVSRAERRTEEI